MTLMVLHSVVHIKIWNWNAKIEKGERGVRTSISDCFLSSEVGQSCHENERYVTPSDPIKLQEMIKLSWFNVGKVQEGPSTCGLNLESVAIKKLSGRRQSRHSSPAENQMMDNRSHLDSNSFISREIQTWRIGLFRGSSWSLWGYKLRLL